MERVRVLWLILVAILGFSGVSNASLWDRGGGLIYDDVLNITWLQDANYAQTSGYVQYPSNGYMYWEPAKAWNIMIQFGKEPGQTGVCPGSCP